MKLRKLIQSNKGLIAFFIASYLDKALVFLLPIMILQVAGDEAAYNDVEYVCSLANIAVPFLTFVSGYAFYGYKISEDKDFFSRKYKEYSSLSTLLIFGISLIVTFTASKMGVKSIRYLEAFISIRIAFNIFTQYFNCYFRLVDRPVMSILYSLLVNIASGVLLIIVSFLHKGKAVEAFFAPECFTTVLALYFFIQLKHDFSLKEYVSYLKRSILFSWPIVLNSTLVAFVANYGKVYAYNFLTPYEMYSFSFILRIATVMQLSHQALMAFFSKDIYMKGYTKKFIYSYLAVIAMAFMAVIVLMLGYNAYFAQQEIPLNGAFFMVLLYLLLHMASSILEVDFSRNNNNILIFAAALISCLIYLGLIYLCGVKGIFSLALYMTLYMLIYLMILLVERKWVKEA